MTQSGIALLFCLLPAAAPPTADAPAPPTADASVRDDQGQAASEVADNEGDGLPGDALGTPDDDPAALAPQVIPAPLPASPDTPPGKPSGADDVAATRTSYAVMPLTASGVPGSLAANLSSVLSAEVKKLPDATVISRDDIKAILQFEADKAALGCNEEESCMAELADALGVDRLVVGQVGRVADSLVVSLQLIDANLAKVEHRVSDTFNGADEQLVGAVRFLVRSLLGITDDTPGRLLVSCDQPDAEVRIDGEVAGVLPLPPIKGLSPGRHAIQVAKDGFLEFSGDVYVLSGEAAAQWVSLPRAPLVWYEQWWLWTAVGAAAVTVIGAATATVAFIAWPRPPPSGDVFVTVPPAPEAR